MKPQRGSTLPFTVETEREDIPARHFFMEGHSEQGYT